MDDTNKQPLQSSSPVASQQGGTLVQFPTSTTPVVPPQTQTPVPSGYPKEQEPFPSKLGAGELVSTTEQPVELEPDVKEAGVTEIAQTPTIPQDLAQMGVQASTPTLSSTIPPTPKLKIPISLEKAENITKGSFLFKNPSSSLLWLAMVVLRQLRIKQKEESRAA